MATVAKFIIPIPIFLRYQNNGVGWCPLLLCNGNSSYITPTVVGWCIAILRFFFTIILILPHNFVRSISRRCLDQTLWNLVGISYAMWSCAGKGWLKLEVNLTFFAPWLPWQWPPFWIYSTPNSCHTLRWIFLQSFMKFDEGVLIKFKMTLPWKPRYQNNEVGWCPLLLCNGNSSSYYTVVGWCIAILRFFFTILLLAFWNIRRKALKFYKFDEKRAITPRWVIIFTSKLQGR
jgi:hypothetical protein